MQHANSPLTPKGRHRMVLRVEEERLTFEAAAAASNVAKSTCWEGVLLYLWLVASDGSALLSTTSFFWSPSASAP